MRETECTPDQVKPGPADANAVTHCLTVGLDQIEEMAWRIDNDCAGSFLSVVRDFLAQEAWIHAVIRALLLVHPIER